MGLLARNLLFTVIVPGSVGVYVPLWLSAGHEAAGGPWLAVGVALLLLGGALYVWCVFDFARFGRGTPAPVDAPKHLVVRGPYRLSRNPMYVAVLAVILGWAALRRAPELLAYALAVATCFHLFVVLYEERRLGQLFPGEYEAYCARVPRWLPRRPRAPLPPGAGR